METTNFGFVASLLFVGVPTIFLIGLFISTQDGEKSSFYSCLLYTSDAADE